MKASHRYTRQSRQQSKGKIRKNCKCMDKLLCLHKIEVCLLRHKSPGGVSTLLYYPWTSAACATVDTMLHTDLQVWFRCSTITNIHKVVIASAYARDYISQIKMGRYKGNHLVIMRRPGRKEMHPKARRIKWNQLKAAWRTLSSKGSAWTRMWGSSMQCPKMLLLHLSEIYLVSV